MQLLVRRECGQPIVFRPEAAIKATFEYRQNVVAILTEESFAHEVRAPGAAMAITSVGQERNQMHAHSSWW